MEFGADNCHLFLEGCRRYSVSELARRFKGADSRSAWQTCQRETSRQGLYGTAYWSSRYFYESIGRVTSEKIRHYIEGKQKKHWGGMGQEQGQKSLDHYT